MEHIDLWEGRSDWQSDLQGWTNWLIWGDNKNMMASLLDEFEGQVDYAYDGQHFVSRWQTYRTRKDRSLESEFAMEEPKVSGNQVVIKVVDIFGDDTNKLVEVKRK